ncbi:MAG TPA: DUF2147 domain-containing protein [Allosphingosinicella sp.]|jgi:uncharacterized protein (DUF2147 family)|nr:DUF2147 domain-containing protein [Allosphingosinicella sp.]
MTLRLGWKRLFLAALTGAAATPAASAATLDGLWQNRKGTLDVRVAPCGSGYCGTVVEARGEAAAQAGGRSRLVGTRVLEDFTPTRDGLWRGRVYAPQLHGRLSSKIRIVDPNTIEITACLFAGLGCDSNLWHRIGEPRESAAASR